MEREEGEELSHEHYTAGVVKHLLRDVIENHPANTNFGFRADEVTALLSGETEMGHQQLLWRELISGQLDADRADYLLRDAYHAGVEYGYAGSRHGRCLRTMRSKQGERRCCHRPATQTASRSISPGMTGESWGG